MTNINIVILRGLGGIGYMDNLAARCRALKKQGVDYVQIGGYDTWKTLAGQLRRFSDKSVLIGHSFGVTGVLGAARRAGLDIPLVVTFDPSQYAGASWPLIGSGGNVVPMNVRKVINFYQVPWMPLAIGGQKLYRDDGSLTGVTNTRVSNTSHVGISGREDLYDITVRAILDITGGKL